MNLRQLTQAGLGAALGLNQSTIGRWMNGAVPHKRTAQSLADYFNVPVDTLLDDARPLPGTGADLRVRIKEGRLTEAESQVLTRVGNYAAAARENLRAGKWACLKHLPPADAPWAMEVTHPTLVSDIWRFALLHPPGEGDGYEALKHHYFLDEWPGFEDSPEAGTVRAYFSHCRNVQLWQADKQARRNLGIVTELLNDEQERYLGESWTNS